MSDPAPEPRPSRLRRSLAEPFDRNPVLLILAALLWALLWMALEAWFQRRGVGPVLQALAPLGVCLAAALVLGLGAPVWARRLLTSHWLAPALGIALLAGFGGGWAVVQARGGEVLPGGFLGWPLSLFATVRYSDLVRSLWVESLLIPLAAMALTLLWTRRTKRNAALFLLATGSLLLAMGSLWNRAAGVRATQILPVGGTSGVFIGVRDAEESTTLPGFRVRMERLDATPREPAFRLETQAGPGVAASPWSSRVESGQSGNLPGGLRYQVERLIPAALPSGQVVEDPQAPENPALQVMLGLGNAEPLVGVLFARDPEGWRRDEPQGRFAVVYRERFDPALLQALRPHPPLSQKLVLTFMGKTLEHPVRPGGVWDLPGFSLTVTGLYPDLGGLRKGKDGQPELFTRSPIFRNPWLQLQLRQASGAQAPLLLSARPVPGKDYADYLARTLPPGMTLRYVPEGEETQGRFVLITREDGKVRLVADGHVVRTEALTLNRPFLVEKGLSVTPMARYDRARFEPDFVPDPGMDASARSGHAVLRLRVWAPATGATESHWLEAQGADGQPVGAAFLGGRIHLVYRPKAPDLRDLSCTLTIEDPAGTELARGMVTSGNPLVFRGHRFYLEGWLPGPPAAARVLLATDPGLWLGWIGLACLLVGGLWRLLASEDKGRSGTASSQVQP